MAFRIFIAVILVATLYFGVEASRFFLLQNKMLNAPDEYSIHPDDHDLVMVGFLDYNCTPCKDANSVIMNALEQDGRIHYIPRPVDIVERDGFKLARLPYAAARQGQFFEMHEALLNNYRAMDQQVLQDITLELGIDQDQLMRDYEDEEIIKLAQKNQALFEKMRLTSVPSYAIGSKIMFSPAERAPSTQDFIEIFEEARGSY